MIHVFTSAAVNYLPKVRVLCSSIKRYHPEWMVHLALPDVQPEWFNLEEELIDSIITIDELDIPDGISWIFRHTLVELSTAIKPFVVQYLLRSEGCEGVLYFDPDMVLFSRLDDLVAEWDKGSICLTPHQTKPEQNLEAIVDNEIGSLRYGIYNLGFLGVKKDEEGGEFTKWWSQRLYLFCREGLNQGLWTDQKWIDLAPALFQGIQILKSSRFNVAAWNITTRKVTGSLDTGFFVDDEPLGFYHFSGWDSGAHKVMATKYGGENPAIMDLVKFYGELSKEDPRCKKTPWGYGNFDNNEQITKTHRTIYRMRKDLQNEYPDPYHVIPDGHCYYNWFNWRAEIEHPEFFGQTEYKNEELIPHANGTGEIDWRKIRRHFKKAVKDSHYFVVLWRKAIEVMEKEGFRGVINRFERL